MDRKEIRETIGVTALVLSLIFVGLEMRQNTRLLQAQTRDAITSKQLETVSWVATDQQNSRVFRVGWDSMETLTPDEEWQYATLVQGIMREWENSHYQAGLGLFTREEIEARQEAWCQNMISSSGFRDVWDQQRLRYAASFRAVIDNFVADSESFEQGASNSEWRDGILVSQCLDA